MRQNVSGELSRRLFLSSAAILGLAACAPIPGGPETVPATAPGASPPPRSTTPSPQPPHAEGTTHSEGSAEADGELAATPAPGDASHPTRAEIIDQFGHLTPTEWGLVVTGVVTGVHRGVALTFDACGGPSGSGVDEQILELLLRHEVPATLFLNLRWINANPALTQELHQVPHFELANHGSAHVPLSVTGRSAYGIPGTNSVGEVVDEVRANTERLAEITGVAPRYFRAGTAHLDEVAAQVVRALGQVPVNFTVNVDAGATARAQQVAAAVAGARAGDICLAHMNRPASEVGAGWRMGLPLLLDSGVRLGTLSESGLLEVG